MKNDCVIYETEIKLLTHSVSSNHVSYDDSRFCCHHLGGYQTQFRSKHKIRLIIEHLGVVTWVIDS